MKKIILSISGLFTIITIIIIALSYSRPQPRHDSIAALPATSPTTVPTVIITPAPSIAPTPTPMSFADQNKLYGPCTVLPVLMYHHIQPEVSAKADHQTSLTVDTAVFQKQMAYLKAKNYHSISPSDLVNFFDQGISLPPRSIMLTFDDAYNDFATNAAPILQQNDFKATSFVPTGLVDNPDYMTWPTIKNLAGTGLFTFANHTWSHHSMNANLAVIQKEISTAATQLTDNGLSSNIFAYPYGTTSQTVVNYLSSNKFELAFTTRHGLSMCKKQRLTLPRLRVGNASLSSYGL